MAEDWLKVLADVAGWGYFFAWIVSFLPQIYNNWRRKSVVGYSLDTLMFYTLSYIAYSTYNITVYFDIDIQNEIMSESQESSPVKLNDVGFALVALLCMAIQCFQCIIYDRGSQTVHYSSWLLCTLSIVAGGILAILAAFKVVTFVLPLMYFGYVKMGVAILQYTPQVWLNYRRQCTEGFHIGGVLLDFIGGILSLLQQDIYCVIAHSTKQLTGNIPKMALAIVSLVFILILIIQHYVLYMGNKPPELFPDNQPLLWESSQSHKYCAVNRGRSELLSDSNDANDSPFFTGSH